MCVCVWEQCHCINPPFQSTPPAGDKAAKELAAEAAPGAAIEVLPLDASDIASIHGLVDAVAARFDGQVDVLVRWTGRKRLSDGSLGGGVWGFRPAACLGLLAGVLHSSQA